MAEPEASIPRESPTWEMSTRMPSDWRRQRQARSTEARYPLQQPNTSVVQEGMTCFHERRKGPRKRKSVGRLHRSTIHSMAPPQDESAPDSSKQGESRADHSSQLRNGALE